MSRVGGGVCVQVSIMKGLAPLRQDEGQGFQRVLPTGVHAIRLCNAMNLLTEII